MPDAKTIGYRIEQLRKSKGLSVSKFAELIGVTSQAVSQYESGVRIPRDETKKRISIVLKRSVNFIFFED